MEYAFLLISQTIKEHTEAIEILIDCLEKGVLYYQNKPQMILTLFQFFQCAIFLQRYLLSMNESKGIEKLCTIIQEMKKSVKLTDCSYVSLATMRFLNVINCHTQLKYNLTKLEKSDCEKVVREYLSVDCEEVDPILKHHADIACANIFSLLNLNKTIADKENKLPSRFFQNQFLHEPWLQYFLGVFR